MVRLRRMLATGSFNRTAALRVSVPAPGAVIGDQGFLRRPNGIGDVFEVDSDPVPHGTGAAHSVDQDVGHL